MGSEENQVLRVMSLHALAYCERLFYLEEVEGIYVQDGAVFEGRRMHVEEGADPDDSFKSFELESETLGLRGKFDAARKEHGAWRVIEHKKGRSRRENGKAAAWPADELQVLAYSLLLQEAVSEPVKEATIKYHADHSTVHVPVDESSFAKVSAAIKRAHEISQTVQRPPIASNPNLCLHCSLAPVCLPEEERWASDEDWEPIRLFPADQERKTIHIVGYDARVSKKDENIEITSDKEKQAWPVQEVGELVMHGYAQITTQALHFCAQNEIGVHWLSFGGKYIASMSRGAGPVQRKIRQYEALRSSDLNLKLAQRLAMNKAESQLQFLLRASRQERDSREKIEEQIKAIRAALRGMAHSESLDELRGQEGTAARNYFAALPVLLSPELDPSLMFSGRNRRPPKDRFNALLSYGYGLLYRSVMNAILTVGLDPAFGFFHQPRSQAHPLALDLMEIFRVPLWDMPLIASLNRKQWDTSKDFREFGNQVLLDDSGRKKAIGLYERRLEDQWKHPAVNYSMSYARLVELEVRLLEKEWSGSPGLFARFRLR